MSPRILDCTLRDGGYYNRWDFSPELAKALLAGLDRAGVDIIEVGYRSVDRDGFHGLFKYCDEALLADLLPADRTAKLAFMLDAKEFIDGDEASLDKLRSVIDPADESLFDWIRIATHPKTIAQSAQMVRILREWGYEVALNIMGISALEGDAFDDTVKAAAAANASVLYLADSYGSLTPETTLEKIRGMRRNYDGPIGVHMHENCGLAMANSLAALDEGVDFVDATVSGMGRGAGNLRMEQFLLWMYLQGGRDELQPEALLPVLSKHLGPMKAEYGWGWDFTYMLSGLIGIHPTYCQELKTGARHDLSDVASILNDIPPANRARYSRDQLIAAEDRHADRVLPQSDEVPVGEAYQPLPSDTVLVLAGGPHLCEHAAAIRRFIEVHNPALYECNDTGVVPGVPRTTVVLNEPRMRQLAGRHPSDPERTIVTGLPAVPGSVSSPTARVDYDLGAGRFAYQAGEIVIPAYVVGMLAVALGLQAGAKRIWIAGFDGFDDPGRRAEQSEMDTFWALVRQVAPDVELVSLLPTTYDVPVRSVYGMLT